MVRGSSGEAERLSGMGEAAGEGAWASPAGCGGDSIFFLFRDGGLPALTCPLFADDENVGQKDGLEGRARCGSWCWDAPA